MVRCPECRAEVQADWDWCHACGWDPEGLRPRDAALAGGSTPTPPPPRGSTSAPPPPPTRPTGPEPAVSCTTVALIGAVAAFGLVIVAIAVVGFLGAPDPVAAPATTPSTAAPTTAPTTVAPPTTPSTVAEVWMPWTDPDGRVTVELPAEPTYEEPAIGGLVDRQQEAIATTPTGEYQVWVYHFSPTADALFAWGATNRFSVSTGDIIRIQQPTSTPRELAGMEGTLTTGSVTRDGVRLGASILVGTRDRRSYVLIAVDGPAGAADAERFFASFSFT